MFTIAMETSEQLDVTPGASPTQHSLRGRSCMHWFYLRYEKFVLWRGGQCLNVFVGSMDRWSIFIVHVLETEKWSDVYLLLVLAGWTGWSDPVWLMPVSVMPSDGFFFSLLLSVRFRSMDQSWYTQTDKPYNKLLQIWLIYSSCMTTLCSEHAFTPSSGRTSQACALQHSLKPVKHFSLKLYMHACWYCIIQCQSDITSDTSMYRIHHL